MIYEGGSNCSLGFYFATTILTLISQSILSTYVRLYPNVYRKYFRRKFRDVLVMSFSKHLWCTVACHNLSVGEILFSFGSLNTREYFVVLGIRLLFVEFSITICLYLHIYTSIRMYGCIDLCPSANLSTWLCCVIRLTQICKKARYKT